MSDHLLIRQKAFSSRGTYNSWNQTYFPMSYETLKIFELLSLYYPSCEYILIRDIITYFHGKVNTHSNFERSTILIICARLQPISDNFQQGNDV